jgi:hypothetical protein
MNTRKSSFPYYSTTQSPGTMVVRNLILYYVKKLPCSFSHLVVPEKKNYRLFLFLCYYFCLGKGSDINLNNPESLSTKKDLCKLWLEVVQRFWRSQKYKSLIIQTDRWLYVRRTRLRKSLLSFQHRWDKTWNLHPKFIWKFICWF